MNALPFVCVIAVAVGCHRGVGDENVSSSDGDGSEAPTSGGTATESASETSAGASSGTGAGFDPERWVGVYHYRHPIIPIGEPVDVVGVPSLANLEILANSHATMEIQSCSDDADAIRIDYVYTPLGADALALEPGPEESSLRYWAIEDLQTVTVTRDGNCSNLRVDVVGGSMPITEHYDPGEVCWVNRCDNPPSEVYIEYCAGEPPPCD